MYEVRHVGVLSVALAFGGMSAAFGLVGGVLITVASLGLSSLGGGYGPGGMLFGVGSIIILPITYGIGGFISGLISAFVYNLVAGIVGGVRLKLVESRDHNPSSGTAEQSRQQARADDHTADAPSTGNSDVGGGND
jgi:hypothetical protein